MKEKDFQTKFLKWAKNQTNLKSGAFELKLTKGKSLPFSALQPHQKQGLLNTKHSKLAYKIPDDTIGYKPFDCVFLKELPAFVVIQFYKRGEKNFYMIDIDDWVKLEEKSKRKSITEEMANKNGLRLSLVDDCYI